MQTLFVNQIGRLRSGWRAFIFLSSFLFLSSVLIFVGLALIAELKDAPTGILPLLFNFAVYLCTALFLGWIYGRVLEGVPFRSMGCAFTSGWAGHLGSGVLIGLISLVLTVIIATAAGGLQFSLNRASEPAAILKSLVTTAVIFVIGAAAEETMVRGYLLQTFSRARLFWLGAGISSLLFALAHRANPDATDLSAANTLLAGIWFCVAYARTRDLWFPFGIHFMWNWLQGPVFGINVSGMGSFALDPIFRATDVGPVWLTGGSYGVEGGLACTVAIAVAIGLTYYMPGLTPDAELLELTSTEKPLSTRLGS